MFLGATGNANIADKESGMLSMEAFLALYDATKDPMAGRAEAAGNFAESWIWVWNVPMPLDANDATLHWKKGVPTIGVNGIGSDVPGGVDQYLGLGRSLLRQALQVDPGRALPGRRPRPACTTPKSMLALPGRTYDMLGPGWQQEHWSMGPGHRGLGAHRNWLPWVSINHLHSIMGLEQFDKDLYQRLAKGN